MENEYYICIIASHEGLRKHAEASKALLDLCKRENAFFVEDAGHIKLLNEIKPGCVILLKYNYNVVAYGTVKSSAHKVAGAKGMDSPFRIDVDDLVWMRSKEPEMGYNTLGSLSENILVGINSDKIKRLKNSYAEEIIRAIDEH